MTSELNVQYRACIWSLIYLLSTTVDLSFAVHKLAKFHQTLVKNTLKNWYIYRGTLGTIRLWAWSIMLVWMMHRYMNYWDNQLLILRINWWISLIIIGKLAQTLLEVQEHTLYFIKMGQFTMLHMFQYLLLNQVQKVSTMQHALQEWL